MRFPNWPVQRLLRLQASESVASPAGLPEPSGHQRGTATVPEGRRAKIATGAEFRRPFTSAIAVYAAPADAARAATKKRKRSESATADDLKFVRELYPSARSGPAIIAVSPNAWTAGVRPGMPLAEARSMAAPAASSPRATSKRNSATRRAAGQSGQSGRTEPARDFDAICFFEWSPADDRAGLLAAAELTRSFAPMVALDELPVPDCLMLDITGCGSLFGGESVLAEQLLAVMRRSGYRCRAAVSDSVATAWAFAHADERPPRQAATSRGALRTNASSRATASPADADWDLPVIIVPPGQATNYLQPLPLSTVRLPLSDLHILSQLGILKIEQLLQLPVEDLPSRLSETAVLRIRQLQGVDSEILTSIPEADPIAAAWSSEFPATNLSEVKQVLEHLTEIIVAQLQRRHVGATRLVCRLKLESGGMLPLAGETVRPVQSAEHLLDVLTLKLESFRLPEPVSSVKMQATVAPLPAARQQDLFSLTEHIAPQEELAILLDRLSSRLGPHAVLTAELHDDARPERAVKFQPVIATAADSSVATSTTDRIHELVTPDDQHRPALQHSPRPLLLLPHPVRISNSAGNALRDGFAWQGASFEVASAAGPERIQTAWWSDDAVHRDYFRVLTTGGSRFWVFRDLTEEAWFLHGVFE